MSANLGSPLGGLQLSNGKSLSHLTNTVGREFDKLAVHCIMCHMYGDWRRRIVARSVSVHVCCSLPNSH